MAICDNIIQSIESTECFTNSLPKINSNFTNLQTTFCTLKDKFDKKVQIRTFFYYGPNSDIDSRSGMDNNQASRPSPETIFAFVNSSTQLNLPAISKVNDIAYVIYQKTGFAAYNGNTFIPNVNTDNSWIESSEAEDINYKFAPALIIWKLVFDGKSYNISVGFPKFHRELTSASLFTDSDPDLWLNPQDWSIF